MVKGVKVEAQRKKVKRQKADVRTARRERANPNQLEIRAVYVPKRLASTGQGARLWATKAGLYR